MSEYGLGMAVESRIGKAMSETKPNEAQEKKPKSQKSLDLFLYVFTKS